MSSRSLQARVKIADQIELEHEIERYEAMERARNGLLNFTLYTKPNYQVGWHHKNISQKLNRFMRREIKRLMIFVPPRHGKSELVSRRLPAMILGRNPDSKVITASHTASLASAMNRDVQRIIDSPSYKELFPDTLLSNSNVRTMGDGSYLRNSEVFEIVGHEGAYRCAGVGGAITGLGGDFLLLDDPIKNREEANSPVYRQKLFDWYVSTFSSRGEGEGGSANPDACILITLTRWHEDDLAGRLLALAKADPEADQWEVINFPAIKEATENPDDPREEGEALWPWKYPLPILKAKRATGGSREFNSLYQQRPSSEEGDLLKREWMTKRYKVLPDLGERKRWDNLLVSSDLRFKDDNKSGDYVVNQVWGRIGSQAYFLGESRGRWGFTESLTEFVKIAEKSPIGGFKSPLKLVENKANGPALENVLKKKISGIVLEEPEGSKTARVNSVTPLWEAGNVWLPDETIYPGISAIVEEWVSFGPGCAFDDRTDAMSQALKRFQTEMDNTLQDLVRW